MIDKLQYDRRRSVSSYLGYFYFSMLSFILTLHSNTRMKHAYIKYFRLKV